MLQALSLSISVLPVASCCGRRVDVFVRARLSDRCRRRARLGYFLAIGPECLFGPPAKFLQHFSVLEHGTATAAGVGVFSVGYRGRGNVLPLRVTTSLSRSPSTRMLELNFRFLMQTVTYGLGEIVMIRTGLMV